MLLGLSSQGLIQAGGFFKDPGSFFKKNAKVGLAWEPDVRGIRKKNPACGRAARGQKSRKSVNMHVRDPKFGINTFLDMFLTF